MVFRKICNDTSTMSADELAHNFVFVKNREAWYRDFDREISVRDLMREICAKHAAPADVDELTDEELDEILYDNLQFGTDDLEGVFALLYMALYGMADVRAWLERYETTGLPTTNRPEVLQECVATYGAEAQVDMAVEEMSELTKALLKYRRKAAQGSKDLEAARENILEEVADVIIMLTQLIMIYGGRDLVQETIENKVDRQIKRLANTERETSSEAAQEVLQPATQRRGSMVAIYILAGIGGFCLLGFVGMVLLFIFSSAPDPEEEKEEKEKTYTCALTDYNCIYVGGQGSCNTCPVREEAEKIGNR